MDLYHEHVLEHYKHPRGRGTLTDATISFSDTNPLCGDAITVQLIIDDNTITTARHQGTGCAVSQAGASMLFERLEGLTVLEALALPKETILGEFGSALSVSRVKCALLAFSAVKKALVKNTPEEHHAHHH